jgi:hypothetical protein
VTSVGLAYFNHHHGRAVRLGGEHARVLSSLLTLPIWVHAGAEEPVSEAHLALLFDQTDVDTVYMDAIFTEEQGGCPPSWR